jgi:hypothetical protein
MSLYHDSGFLQDNHSAIEALCPRIQFCTQTTGSTYMTLRATSQELSMLGRAGSSICTFSRNNMLRTAQLILLILITYSRPGMD